MFAEKFDALMNIAEISNSQLGRDINMNSSHIGRLRSGARPLPKKHEYLGAMCRYLSGHIKKEYQIIALQKLTGISSTGLASPGSIASYLEYWLTAPDSNNPGESVRLTSGAARRSPDAAQTETMEPEILSRYASYLYGNAGKRKAVEQFFTMVLQEEKPQTLLLFSDENMSWLYEDSIFAAKWAELFKKIIMKGNRVKIIHTISRNMNEMIEAVSKWIPIYMTGMIEPYCYPKLRDGIFQRTLFIAPNTAAIASSSVRQNTDGMLNLFITDRAAIRALVSEYEQFFSLCRPLINIYTSKDEYRLQGIAESLSSTEGNACYCSTSLPLFALPEEIAKELSGQIGNDEFYQQWQQSLAAFSKAIKKQHLTLVLPDPQYALKAPDILGLHMGKPLSGATLPYSKKQYLSHINNLVQMEKELSNLKLCFVKQPMNSTRLYIKEDTGVIMIKSGNPPEAFSTSNQNMVSAFWDYLGKVYGCGFSGNNFCG